MSGAKNASRQPYGRAMAAAAEMLANAAEFRKWPTRFPEVAAKARRDAFDFVASARYWNKSARFWRSIGEGGLPR